MQNNNNDHYICPTTKPGHTLNLLSRFQPITSFIFETDHVLTDGYIGLGAEAPIRRFYAKDLFAMQKAVAQGYQISWVATAELPVIQSISASLEMNLIENRRQLPVVASMNHTLYMNSIFPVAAQLVNNCLYCCPADAVPDVKKIAAYISPFNGGTGCVYDVIEKVLKLNGHW